MAGFDAKSILDAIVAGNSQPAQPSQADLSTILTHAVQAGQGTAPGGGGLAPAPRHPVLAAQAAVRSCRSRTGSRA